MAPSVPEAANMPNGVIQSRAYRELRATLRAQWRAANAPCAICGQRHIDYDAPAGEPDSFEMDHRISRRRARAMGRPDLDLDPGNMQPTALRCNRSKGAGAQKPDIGQTTEEW